MKEILDKLKKLLIELENEMGTILIFALFLREDSPNKWDLIVAADWLNSGDVESYRIVATKTQNILDQHELLQLSRVVILDADDPLVISLQTSFDISNGGAVELSNCELSSQRFKFPIKHAYILRCIKK